MKNNNYLLPGIAAIVLAVLFPMYWIQEAISGAFDGYENYLASAGQLSVSSWVFLLMGLLSIYIYYSFRRILHDQLNFKSIDVLLWIMIGTSAIFFVGLFILDAWPASSENTSLIGIGVGISVGSLILFGIADIIIAVILLRHFDKLPSLLKALAILSLIQGVFELSVVMGLATIATFPIYLVILAVYFLRKPETIEVV